MPKADSTRDYYARCYNKLHLADSFQLLMKIQECVELNLPYSID